MVRIRPLSDSRMNKVVRGVHGIGERADSPLKITSKALRRVSLDPWRIGAITEAALVLVHSNATDSSRRLPE